MHEPIDRQKLINYKNKLMDESKQYYDWASINENKQEEKIEFALASKIEQIATDLKNILYP